MSSKGHALMSVCVCTRVSLCGTLTLPWLQSLQTEVGAGSFSQEEKKNRIVCSSGHHPAGSPQEPGVAGTEKGGGHLGSGGAGLPGPHAPR